MVWVSQLCHSLTCWSSTGCKTKPWESLWEQQRTHPLRPCATYWTCHPWKRQKVEQVKAYLSEMQNQKNPLHDAVKEEKGCRQARSKSWMGQAEQSVQDVCSLAELKQVRDWEKRPVEFKPYYKTLLSENLGTHCHEWPAGKTNAEVQMHVEAKSKRHDIMIYISTWTAQPQGPDLVGASRPSRLEGLCAKIVEPTESRPLAWPWR